LRHNNFLPKLMTCDLCKSTEQNTRGKRAHERLQQVGLTERVGRAPRGKAIWVTRFRCDVCGTHWRHDDDLHTGIAAWSIERLAAATATAE
jgi:hypothetical protein